MDMPELKLETIGVNLATAAGHFPVEGITLEGKRGLAVTPTPTPQGVNHERYSVTHTPSGYRVGDRTTIRAVALMLVTDLYALDIDWTQSREAIVDNKTNRKRIREVLARYAQEECVV